MKVVLAEKPSVARDLALFLSAGSKRDGYFEGSGYQVTWSLGHLATLKEPEDYDPALKRWSLDALPIVPDRFDLKLVDDQRARRQFGIIQCLFRSARELICATDAGREGELIFRYILHLAGCDHKPFRRLWLSSLTEEAIRDAFDHLRPGHDFDDLYAAARCRSESDWIVGLNATRCFTVRYGVDRVLWSVGRVQTPILALIVRRDDEIRSFKIEPYWELLTRYRQVVFQFKGDRFEVEADARALLERIRCKPFVVTKVSSQQEKSLPPMLYDLTELQRDMNRRFAMSAAATLETAQSLYERKLLTYPRTDSRFLSSDMREEVPGILRKLADTRREEIGRLDLNALPFSARIINDRKVSDHHAIIPTGKLPRSLPSASGKVFGAVLTRLVAVFYPPCLKEVTTVDGQSDAVPFRARGARVLDPGWTALYPRKPRENEQQKGNEQLLPEFVSGESGPHEPFVRSGETKPPPHFTENSLLGAMETAGKMVDDEGLREALKEKGLGTPATRAAIIETLLKRGYIVRDQKALTATDLGRYLVVLVRDPQLKSAELTGEWEAKLKQIEQGRFDPDRFMGRIVKFTTCLIDGCGASEVDESRLGPCPRCGREVIEGRRGYGCSGWREGCGFVLWRQHEGVDLTIDQIRRLIQRRILLEPLDVPGKGPAVLYLSDSGAVMDIEVPSGRQQKTGGGRVRRNHPAGRRSGTRSGRPRRGPDESAGASGTELGHCPLCGAAVVEQPRSYNCSAWKGGCQFTIWKTVAGKHLSARTARTLLHKGRTSLLKGFKSKAGKPFDARLKVEAGQVRFEFNR